MSFSCWQFGTSMELPWESTKTSMAQARATSTSVGFGRPGPCIRFFSKWPPTWNLHLSDSFFNYISTSSWNMFAVESPHRHSPAFGRSYGQPSLKKSQPTTTFFLIYCSCLAQNMSNTFKSHVAGVSKSSQNHLQKKVNTYCWWKKSWPPGMYKTL